VTGLIVLDVRREFVALLRTTLTKREGLVALEGEMGDGHNFYTVLPRYSDLRAETEALIIALPEGTKITRIIGNQRYMGRDDSGLGVMIDQDWVRLQLTLPKWPTFHSGPEILWNASGPNAGSPHSGTMIALGVEGESSEGGDALGAPLVPTPAGDAPRALRRRRHAPAPACARAPAVPPEDAVFGVGVYNGWAHAWCPPAEGARLGRVFVWPALRGAWEAVAVGAESAALAGRGRPNQMGLYSALAGGFASLADGDRFLVGRY
jgi:hypothetical protein